MKKYSILSLTLITFLLHSCSSFGQDKPLGQILFTINNNGHIIIILQINNEEISNFVLDTGASVPVIDKKSKAIKRILEGRSISINRSKWSCK